MNTRVGRGGDERRPQMEGELSAWLHGFEPTGTPIAVRLRTYADLREEAARPRPRLPWLMPALSSMASLGSVVAGAGLLVLLAIIGASAQPSGAGAGSLGSGVSGVGPTPQSPLGGDYSYGPDPIGILMLVVCSVLAGCTVLIPRVRRLVGRIALAGGKTAPLAPLPLRRSWRSIPFIVWPLGALAVGMTLWGCRGFLNSEPSLYVLSLGSVIVGIAAIFTPFVVAWRYPLRDLSARLLLFSALASIAGTLFYVALEILGVTSWDNEWLLICLGVVWAFAAIALAAGLARRSGSVRRPPLRLAAVAVGAAFLLSTAFLFFNELGGDQQLRYLLESVANYLEIWVVMVAWLAILWVGFSAWRRDHSSWGWKLLLAAGALHLLAGLPNDLEQIYYYLVPDANQFGAFGGWMGTMWIATSQGTMMVLPEFWWQMIAMSASQIALLLALISGLRPVPSGSNLPAAEPSSAELSADTEVAGETAGH